MSYVRLASNTLRGLHNRRLKWVKLQLTTKILPNRRPLKRIKWGRVWEEVIDEMRIVSQISVSA